MLNYSPIEHHYTGHSHDVSEVLMLTSLLRDHDCESSVSCEDVLIDNESNGYIVKIFVKTKFNLKDLQAMLYEKVNPVFIKTLSLITYTDNKRVTLSNEDYLKSFVEGFRKEMDSIYESKFLKMRHEFEHCFDSYVNEHIKTINGLYERNCIWFLEMYEKHKTDLENAKKELLSVKEEIKTIKEEASKEKESLDKILMILKPHFFNDNVMLEEYLIKNLLGGPLQKTALTSSQQLENPSIVFDGVFSSFNFKASGKNFDVHTQLETFLRREIEPLFSQLNLGKTFLITVRYLDYEEFRELEVSNLIECNGHTCFAFKSNTNLISYIAKNHKGLFYSPTEETNVFNAKVIKQNFGKLTIVNLFKVTIKLIDETKDCTFINKESDNTLFRIIRL